VRTREPPRARARARILELTPTARTSAPSRPGCATPSAWRSTPTGELWASVNERDALGDHLVPYYVTHVRDGGFYGWPWLL
jgi:glucose/arabinose dehydrogenase